ncbi:GNAT family N-acetyltransferase [Streptomyces sp. NRRL F-5123]|uniref:GNAT family N-acetyltransferase n=1 Tax=Streptomyces sp. NRRL F-5123 TaxID=1463856 RepID=UPI0004E1A201|nr:GNAT family N-acetyltransferase [Streptomyces sp. NRRL F-5123]
MAVVRRASAPDAPRLVEMHAGVHDLHARHRPDLFVAEPDGAGVRAFFQHALRDASLHVLVAELASTGPVVGYAMARVVESGSSLHMRPGSVVKLEHLAVEPAAARSGVGSALLDAVRAIGRESGCHRLVVNVWGFNSAARSFYEASGLVPVKEQLDQLL